MAPRRLRERLSWSTKMCDGVGGAGDIFSDLTYIVCDLSDGVPQVPACSQVIPTVHSVHDCLWYKCLEAWWTRKVRVERESGVQGQPEI